MSYPLNGCICAYLCTHDGFNSLAQKLNCGISNCLSSTIPFKHQCLDIGHCQYVHDGA